MQERGKSKRRGREKGREREREREKENERDLYELHMMYVGVSETLL